MLTVEEFLNSHKSCKFMLISVAKGSGVLGSTSILTYEDKESSKGRIQAPHLLAISSTLTGKRRSQYLYNISLATSDINISNGRIQGSSEELFFPDKSKYTTNFSFV